jgi:hypothetical protein
MNESERQVLEDTAPPEQLRVVEALEGEGFKFRGWEGGFVMMGQPWGNLVAVGVDGELSRA